MPSAEIITIGTELLLGHLVDTNTSVMARALASIGTDVYRQTSVGDNQARITAAISEALARAEIVLCAGGLGPTVDDMTRSAAAGALARPLELRDDALQSLARRFSSLHLPMSDNNAQQAYVPQGALLLENPHGSAPGFIAESGGRAVIAMPGVPRELVPMLHERVLPWIEARFGARHRLVTRVLKTIGVGESEIDSRIADLFRAGVNPSIAVLAHDGQVDVKITAKAPDEPQALALIAQVEPQLRARLGDAVYALDGGSMEGTVARCLRERGWTLATAESCTGGLIAAMLTSVPGSSDYFRGTIVAYDAAAKLALLDVAQDTIESQGLVSAQTAKEMAIGALRKFDSDLALGVTGVAGPGGGSDEKPVGLVYVALARRDGTASCLRLQLSGDRELVRQRAALRALACVWRHARRSSCGP